MSKRILIVEDDAAFHILYDAILDNAGYRITHAYDGNEALAEVEEERPDLIILDILLDMMTGNTFLLFLKNIPEFADIPVIIVSNYPRQDFKNLKVVDPKLVILDKISIVEELVNKINIMIG